MGRDRLLRELNRERFLVTLKVPAEAAFEGLLDRVDRSTIELLDVFAVAPGSKDAVDGSMIVPRDNVAYMQRVPHRDIGDS